MVKSKLARIAVFSFLFLVTASFWASAAHAQRNDVSVSQDIPITITADTMTYEPEKDRVIFKGNVQAVREEFYMWSNRLTLHLKPSQKTPPPAPAEGAEPEDGSVAEAQPSKLEPTLNPGDLDYIVADGNVRFKFNNQSGTSDKATYTMATAILVLTGNPILKDNENTITGNVVRYFLNENRSEVESSDNKRVQAVFGSNSGQGKR